MDEAQLAAYLARIGVDRPSNADLATLRELQFAHLSTVPFENLSIHRGEPIDLSEAGLLRKLVEQRRGGFCYELNGGFAALLTALGYQVTLLAARTFNGDKTSHPLDHLALRVDLTDPWLVDVGFGAFAVQPLRLDLRTEQSDPAGPYQVVESSRPDHLDVLGKGKPEYQLDLRPYELSDFEPTCWWQQTSPESHFTQSLVCSRLTPTGRITLSGDKLITTANGTRKEEVLSAATEILAAYKDHFGITLDQAPTVKA